MRPISGFWGRSWSWGLHGDRGAVRFGVGGTRRIGGAAGALSGAGDAAAGSGGRGGSAPTPAGTGVVGIGAAVSDCVATADGDGVG